MSGAISQVAASIDPVAFDDGEARSDTPLAVQLCDVLRRFVAMDGDRELTDVATS